MSGFDRMPDPRGETSSSGHRARRALLGSPPAGPAVPESRAAVERGPGVACTRCQRVSPLGPATLLTLLRPPVVWLPWRPAPLRAVCPACRRRAWLEPLRRVAAAV